MKETGVAKGTLMVNGQQVAEGAIERTQAVTFSADETADVGIGLGTPVVEDIGSGAKSKFTVHWEDPARDDRDPRHQPAC